MTDSVNGGNFESSQWKQIATADRIGPGAAQHCARARVGAEGKVSSEDIVPPIQIRSFQMLLRFFLHSLDR